MSNEMFLEAIRDEVALEATRNEVAQELANLKDPITGEPWVNDAERANIYNIFNKNLIKNNDEYSKEKR